MSDKPYIAEFHDIAKLLDREALKHAGLAFERQRLDRIDFSSQDLSKPSCPSWFAPSSEDLNSLAGKAAVECGQYAPLVFLTHIADEIAASFRVASFEEDAKKHRPLAGYRKIWKDAEEDAQWQSKLISTKEDFRKFLEFWDGCRSHTDFLEQYTDQLETISEDKAIPYNITSLQSHLTLVGKIFRVLEADTTSEGLEVVIGGQKVSTFTDAAGDRLGDPKRKQHGKWNGVLSAVQIGFRQHLARLSDLNIIGQRQQAVEDVAAEFPDNVLYHTSDFMLLFTLVGVKLTPERILERLLTQNFDLEITSLEAELGFLVSNFEEQRKKFFQKGLNGKRHLELRRRLLDEKQPWQETISGRICEICQSRPATSEPWTKDKVEEWLCDGCTKIRELHEPAEALAKWEGGTAWIKLSLDHGHLLRILPKLFLQHVKESLPNATSETEEAFAQAFRPLATETDFVKDYQAFLSHFRNEVCSDLMADEANSGFWSYSPPRCSDFLIMPIIDNREFVTVCRVFSRLIETQFPRCRGDSPIQLSLSLSSAKHPYNEHWQFLSRPADPNRPISIQKVNDFQFRLSLQQFDALGSAFTTPSAIRSTALYRLTAIERESASPTVTLFEALKDDMLRIFLKPLLFEHRLSLETILNYYKLTVWQEAPASEVPSSEIAR